MVSAVLPKVAVQVVAVVPQRMEQVAEVVVAPLVAARMTRGRQEPQAASLVAVPSELPELYMFLTLKLYQILTSAAMAAAPRKTASVAESLAIVESMESVVALQRTASVAEPMESTVAQTVAALTMTAVKNTLNRLAWAAAWIQAWTLTETAAAVLLVKVAPLAQQACRSRGRLCRWPRE